MQSRFEGRVVVLAGGASGIGRAMAEAFATENARVVVADLDEARSHAVAKEIVARGDSAIARPTDLRVASEVASLFKEVHSEFGRLDAVCHSAFAMEPGIASEVSLEGWYETIDSCLHSAYLSARYSLPYLIERERGALVLIASTCGIRADYGMAAYDTAKAGLIGLTRSIGIDYADRGIHCNCICPGAVRTPATEGMFAGDDPAERRIGDRLLSSHPSGRVCEPQEVADLAVYLCSDASASINGAVIPIDGGQSAQIGGLARPL